MSEPGGELSYDEAEAVRTDPTWGDLIQQLTLHASHWLETALAAYPEKQWEIYALSRRLDVACGDLSDEHGDFRDLSTVNGVAYALREIAGVMWDAAAYVPRRRPRGH